GLSLTMIACVLLAAMIVYFYISLNKIDEKTQKLAEEVGKNSNQTSGIVNYLNSNLNAGQEQQ
nr:hypothetical protein [Patescibacteria group bacterium]